MTKIIYTQSKATNLPTFNSQKFGNLLADTYQASVDQSSDGTWAAWLLNWSREGKGEFRLGFKSKRAAIRWANSKLREVGV